MARPNAEMERGIAQVLYNFGPGNLFDYSGKGVTMRVTRWETEEVTGVDQARIAEIVSGRVTGFRNSEAPPWNRLSELDVELFSPVVVHGEVFPTRAVCGECGSFVGRDTPKGMTYTNGRCERSGCGGSLSQLDLVLNHECGHLSQINANPCEAHGYEDVRLNRGSADDLTSWSFECGVCGSRTGTLAGHCSGCGDFIPVPTALSAGSIYYPQTVDVVDIPIVGSSQDEIAFGEPWARVLMAAHLGDLDLAADGVTLEGVATNDDDMTGDDLAAAREEYGLQDTDISDEQIRQMLSSSGPGLQSVVDRNKDEVAPAGAAVDRAPVAFSILQQELFTFLRSTHGYEGDPGAIADEERHPNPRPIDSYLDDPEFLDEHPQARHYREKMRKVHIADAWVVGQFPLLNLLFGFTRGTPVASQTDLRQFEHPKGKASVLPVYADRSPSEALILEIDRAAVVRWLIANGHLDADVAPPMDDERELKRWFLENVDVTQTQNPFDSIDDDLTRAVYTLLHTMSHALIMTASDQCGLSTDSISELILASVPAIVIYAKSMEHFALGGMFTLFKTRMHPWIDHAIEQSRRCIYDPACRNDKRGAACHACLHLSEFSCEHFNGELDRRVLLASEDGQTGFWDL